MTNRVLSFENRQAPGDILMMTAMIRDLQRGYPGEFRTRVTTSAQELWRHNPNVTDTGNLSPQDRRNLAKSTRAGYSTSIQQSNQRAAHFATGFHRDASEKLGFHVTPTDLRPDLYLTPDEKASRPIDTRYWVMVSGGKNDFPAKIWPAESCQRVVDLMPDIRFVQVGGRDHRHTRLNGVLDMVGKTSLRELMSILYNADGIVCPVTCMMHFAAAFNKPCVVVAGGREPWWWEAYTRTTWRASLGTEAPADFVEHRYLHTVGALDCCRTGGCWKSGVGDKSPGHNCTQLRDGVPACLRRITPIMVAQAVRDYQDNKPVENTPMPQHLLPPLTGTPLPRCNRPVPMAGQPPVTPQVGHVTYPVGRPRVRPPHRLPFTPTLPPKPSPCSGPVSPSRPGTVTRVPMHPVRRKVRNGVPLRSPAPLPGLMAKKEEPRADYVTGEARICPKGMTTGSEHRPASLTTAVLFYGDYPDLAKRCLASIYSSAAHDPVKLVIGLNAVGAKTRRIAEQYAQRRADVRLVDSRENLFKYPMMRRMFWDPDLDTEWVCWFDDDSYVTAPWWRALQQRLNQDPGVDVYGKPYFIHLKESQIPWIREAGWYRGRPLENRNGVPISNFVTGGWWCCRVARLKAMNWPDPRLQNNGGDVMFGVAARQHQLRQVKYHDHVEISRAKRRGASQRHPGL